MRRKSLELWDMAELVANQKKLNQRFWRWRDRSTAIPLILLGIIILAVLLGPLVYRVSPTAINFAQALRPPRCPTPSAPTTLAKTSSLGCWWADEFPWR